MVKIEEMEKILHSAEKVTASDMNNNPIDKDLPKRLEMYKVRSYFSVLCCKQWLNIFYLSSFRFKVALQLS